MFAASFVLKSSAADFAGVHSSQHAAASSSMSRRTSPEVPAQGEDGRDAAGPLALA
jgi:hypothetical protein